MTQLNRPANAGYNPSSSNNQSNNGYRKKEHVQQAQRAYDKKLRLNLVGDEEGEEQRRGEEDVEEVDDEQSRQKGYGDR